MAPTGASSLQMDDWSFWRRRRKSMSRWFGFYFSRAACFRGGKKAWQGELDGNSAADSAAQDSLARHHLFAQRPFSRAAQSGVGWR
jgi:hypothetical protein